MASKTVVDAGTAVEPTPFLGANEVTYLVGQGRADDQSALLINPNATPTRLLAAAQARAIQLAGSLKMWARVECDEVVSGNEVAASLEPLAEEVATLLDAIATGLRNEANGGVRHG